MDQSGTEDPRVHIRIVTTLDSPIRIGTVLIRNRLYRAPVLEGAGSGPDAPSIYRSAFEENARAGVGLIIQGNSCITEEGRSSPGMTLAHTRERVQALSEVTNAVHVWGARIFLQIGHAGLFSQEAWHSEYAELRKEPIIAVSPPPIHVRPALRGIPVKVLSTGEIGDLAAKFGQVATWAREAGYDGIQIASSNAKLIHQFLSPYYNRRNDEFGGSLRNRARILELVADEIRRQAGDDLPLTVKIPVAEDAPPLSPRITFDDGIALCRLAEDFGYHAITPVGLSVFPHASLCRGAHPRAMLEVSSIKSRFEEALGGSRLKMAILRWGYRRAAKAYPFQPVWNRPYFTAAKKAVRVPVFAVGGIRSRQDCDEILAEDEADMVGMGRPFYAEPDLARRILESEHAAALCESSNRCVPAQQLGMKARCYNPNVAKARASRQGA